ncbi:hypothetical protein AU510_12515 [Lonsdalea britannica]|uniref:PfkB family carbohydrate kinase n=1 Tax=Lonsdalea britannica TaxID=1082704 RepID=UPI000A1E2475|nr:PfkB family carbohydrate kinase [Lonsdalea britannica]OSN04159.1 hypothetical protein AU510_12515 [Lonsdalea britannica]
MKNYGVVIGSVNHDILIQQNRLPGLGETFTGNEWLMMSGGKGANQASVRQAGVERGDGGGVGEDIYGAELMKSSKENQVDVKHLMARGTTSASGIV